MLGLFFVLSVVVPISNTQSTACAGTTLPAGELTPANLLTFTDMRVACSASGITVRLKNCPLETLGHNATNTLAVANSDIATVVASSIAENCKPVLGASTVYAGLDAIFTINISDCNPITTINTTHQIYNYAVRNYLNPNVQSFGRSFDINFQFSCIYVLNIRVSLGLGAGAQISTSRSLSLSSITAELDVAMGLFSDAGFSNPVSTNLPLTVPTSIYVGATLTDAGATYLVLQATVCWATPSTDPYDSSQYPILDSGCPYVDPANPNAIELYENYYSSQAKFSFKSFLWSGLPAMSQVIYVHCRVAVCDTVLSNTCKTKNCIGTAEISGRKRRRSGTGISPHVISLGPISIDGSRTACSRANGGCKHLCSVDIFGTRTCSCRAGYYLGIDGMSCELLADEDWELMKMGEENITPDNALPAEIAVLFIAIVLLLASLVSFYVLPKRWQRQRRARARD
ncbi:uromodulin-like [Ciona intestinalis]